MSDLTHKQAETLKTIKQFISEHGHSPSVRELLPLLGLYSTQTVQQRINVLCDKGYLAKGATCAPRTLKVLKSAESDDES